jgi:hypothetical protein
LIRKSLCALVGATLVCALPASPAAAADSCAVAEAAPKPKKKKGFGLGGILKAANQAGVGNMLGYGNMLGSGRMGQVAGAIAGTAVNAADGSASAQGSASHIGGLMGGHRVAQVAGAVTGTAANLARSAPGGGERSSPTASSTCASDIGAVVNLYK